MEISLEGGKEGSRKGNIGVRGRMGQGEIQGRNRNREREKWGLLEEIKRALAKGQNNILALSTK